ncbi:hypothetical protein K2173_017322 [Erythroxylum novogranatense]|uniref:Uncharacterized protein n=1 Tax=Erythroxylum novogranatense TaxID=1862640 RepID=A0AAV8TKL1_9ROSI|nr:hypothetical protein K2173_017322 [Erythroxylum novogranatense]
MVEDKKHSDINLFHDNPKGDIEEIHSGGDQHSDGKCADDDDSLSLSDLALDNVKDTTTTATTPQRSSSETHDFFEFLGDSNSHMSSAEDIIFCGKLMPFNAQSLQNYASIAHTEDGKKEAIFLRRRSESLSGLQSRVTRSDIVTTNPLFMRNSRSLNNQVLERLNSSKASSEPSVDRSISVKSVGSFGNALVRKTLKPRWYVLMFGSVKTHTEMELKDIKIRQLNRNPLTLFPPPQETQGKSPVMGNTGKSSCGLLKVLSCKDHASVAVTSSFCMPQV